MAIIGVSDILFNGVGTPKEVSAQSNNSNEPILSFAENGNTEFQKNPSDAQINTGIFVEDIMKKLDTSKSKRTPEAIKYYLEKLINVVQILNGVQENKLEPNGNSEQNRIYEARINELKYQLNDYAGFVGSGLNVMQDSRTGLYKLTINDKLYDIPKRKVEILPEETVDGIELTPQIVD